MKALFIKELRERFTVLVIGIVLSLLPRLLVMVYSLSGPPANQLRDFSIVVTGLEYQLLAVFYTIFVGGSALAGEVERKNITFLLSLPVSRPRIWAVKLLVSFFCVAVTLGFFLLVNGSLIEWKRLSGDYRIIDIACTLALPLVMLCIVFFASAVTSREVEANGASLLFLVVMISLTSLLAYLLAWVVLLHSFLVSLVLWALFFLLSSLVIFARADFSDSRRRAGTALKVSLAAFSILAVSQFLLAFHEMRTPPGVPFRLEHADVFKGTMLFLFQYEPPFGRRGNGGFFPCRRSWVMQSPGHAITKLPGSMMGNVRFTPEGSIDYDIFLFPQILDFPLGKEATYELWRSDPAGQKRRLLFRESIDLNSSHHIHRAYHGGRLVLLLPEKGSIRKFFKTNSTIWVK